MFTTPVAASPLPLKGAPLADRQSRIRGGRWDVFALVCAWAVWGEGSPR